MIKTNLSVVLMASMLGLASTHAQATDYSSYSNEQMIQMRNEIQYMSESELNAYRTEMQTRMQTMDSSEREQLRSASGSDSGQGATTRSQLRDGSGGGQYGGSRSGGGGRRN
ncbi:MAG: hypothetical protein OQL09_01455 [Gammaproteobacteria bacterium]|nr:hypothetical protein [Gammaproteobacteria bacterium]